MANAPTQRLSFHGDGGTLFGIFFVNLLLTAVTLGVYSFWARTKVRKYVWSQTEIAGDRFAYHGTGGELFRGYLKAMGILILLAVVTIAGIPLLLRPVLGQQAAVAMGVLAFYAVIVAILPVAMVGARRYRLSRTSWRGIRFSFRGQTGEFIKLYLVGGLLTALTLTLYWPFYANNLRRFFVDGARFGTMRFAYDGEGRDLFGRYLLALLLTLPTLGLYWIWFAAERNRYYWGHTSFGGARFHSTITGGSLLGLAITNWLLVVFTLGFGAPWALVRYHRYVCDNLALEGEIDLAAIEQQAQAASGTGEGLAAALDVDAVDMDLGL
jgi:uncharacterized membrane protein YjgN (DUF898 family)